MNENKEKEMIKLNNGASQSTPLKHIMEHSV